MKVRVDLLEAWAADGSNLFFQGPREVLRQIPELSALPPPDNLGLNPLPSDVIDKLEQSYKSRAEAKTTLVHRLPEVKELVAKQMKIIAACASARELARS